MKCDEKKPACQKCSSTGRTCDGYESIFRPWPGQTLEVGDEKQDPAGTNCSFTEFSIVQRDVELLQRCLSTKTLFDVQLGCDKEARELLEASVTNSAIRHAISSLKSFRHDLELTANPPTGTSPPLQGSTPQSGLEQYCAAMGVLASQLSFPMGTNDRLLRSAMLCCQIFISIEQTRGNFSIMAKHILQGLNIMHEHGARPILSASELLPAKHDDLPMLDVFIIKLFAAPCKFADRRLTAASSCEAGTLGEQCSMERQPGGSTGSQTIAPDMRAALTGIAASALRYLESVSDCRSLAQAMRLAEEKTRLLEVLELWLHDLNKSQDGKKSPMPEPLSVLFMRLFYQVLKLILMGSLDSAPTFYVDSHVLIEELQTIAEHVTIEVEVDRFERQQAECQT